MIQQSKFRSLGIGIAVVMVLAMAGCQQSAQLDPLAGGGGLTGNWAPDGGGYSAQFANGVFRTTATDTGNVISEGSYVAVSASQIELRWQSKITGQANLAQCARPDANVLNCTDSGGKPFVLRRIAA
jgi:hypothetical protein